MRSAGLIVGVAFAAALLALLPPPSASSPPLQAVVGTAAVPLDPPADPFPLRRQFLPADQLDRLTADPRGPFRKLSKMEFEQKVRAAAAAQALARSPPQLVSAAYTGRYDAGGLRGTADWTVANPAARSALLPADGLRLAVTDFTPAKDRSAELFRGKPGGKELPGSFVWVGGERETRLTFGWSVRGVEEADEERFDLGVPAAAIASLKLTLPADRLPALTTAGGSRRIEGTGPFPGPTDGERAWAWAIGGQGGVVLAVRRANTPGAAVVASRAAVFDLLPGEVRAAFDFTLDSPRGLIREQAFAVDAGQTVTGVTGDGVERWRQEPANKLTVTLREPLAGVKLRVTTTAPLGGGAVNWACPGVRAAGTLPGADGIEVNVPPEVKLDGWSAADHRPTVAPTAKGVKLQFAGTLATGPGGTRRPPTVRVRSADPEIATDEAVEWRVEPGRSRFSAVVKVKVLRGPLPQLAFRTAAGYTLDAAALVPEDPTAAFGPLPGTPDGWVVEPSRAVPTGGAVEVRLEFRGPPGPPPPDPGDPTPAGVPLPFPRFAPLGATDRQGTLTVIGERVSPVARTPLPVSPTPTGWEMKYRGREPAGVGWFTPDAVAVSVDAVRLSVSGKVCEATVVGRADDGPVGSLTVFVPHPDGRVKPPDGATVAPLPAAHLVPLLGATDGWSAVAAAGAVPAGAYWRVTFPRPKSGPFELTTAYPVAAIAPDAPLPLPLPAVGGGRGDVAVELSPELAAVFRVADGRTADFPPRVTLDPLANRPPDPSPDGEWRLADVRQVNHLDGDGGLSVTLSGRVTRAAARVLDFTLPAGAEVESAQVGGKWVTLAAGPPVRLPLPDSPADGMPFEVRYRLPAPPAGPLPEYRSPVPELPGGAGVSVRWEFARGWLAWPTLAAGDDGQGRTRVRVAQAAVLRGVGFALGGLILALGVRVVWRGCRVRTALLVLAVGGCGAAAWVGSVGWLKVVQPPLFAGLGVLAAAAFRQPTAGKRRAAGLAGVAVLTLGVQAQPGGEPAVVYVVGTDAQAVYAPPGVLEKLDALAAPPRPDVVVSSATYSGSADDAVATFTATFKLNCPRAGDHPLTLPLAGVRLESLTLDGTDAFPDASKPDRYALTVSGAGEHTLVARFAVPPTSAGGEREVQFGGPEVHRCTVTFDAGAKGRQPDVPSRRGGQTVADRVATADHGANRTIAVRWREAGADGGMKTTVSVKEAAVWDATDGPDAGVWAAFAYRIDGGTADRFEIDIPPGLVATRLLVRPLDPRTTPLGVRGWQAAPNGEGTRVVARLQQPADGRLLVLVRAVPAAPLGPQPVLRFPAASGISDADRDSVYAVRFAGLGVGEVGRGGVIDFTDDAIVKDFPPVPEFAFDKQPPGRVVKRATAAVAELRPTLAAPPPFAAGGAEVVFTAGEWVEAEGAVRAGVKESGFVEFHIPDGIDVRDVRQVKDGQPVGLAGWGRNGSKVQAWLKQPAGEVVIRWAGSLPAGDPTVQLPLPRWGGSISPAEPTTVRVRAADGYAVRPVGTTGLKPKAGAEGEFVYTAEGNPPPLTVEVSPVPPAEKPAAPPAPPAPPPTTAAPPPAPPGGPPPTDTPEADPWPTVGAVAWGCGLLTAAGLLRGWRWRPERVAAVGVLGMLAAGVSTPLGWAFGLVAAAGVLWRLGRAVRRLL